METTGAARNKPRPTLDPHAPVQNSNPVQHAPQLPQQTQSTGAARPTQTSAVPSSSFQTTQNLPFHSAPQSQSHSLSDPERLQKGPRGPASSGIQRVTIPESARPPFKHYDSSQSNQDCALAAFASASGRPPGVFESVYQSSSGRATTAHDSGTVEIAQYIGMRQAGLGDLKTHLDNGGRAFVRTPALNGNGSHAFCAFKTDGNDVIVWDPDQHNKDYKRIPMNLLDKNMIFLA